MKSLISIIVPVYNSSKYIEKCINSLINQTYKNLEILLIDDGSTDDSSLICDKYSKKDERIKVVHKINGGVASARNAGLQICNGDYISFIDSDDYIESNMMELLLKTLETNKADISICNFILEDIDGRIIKKNSYRDCIIDKIEYPFMMYYNSCIQGYACNKLYSRKVIYYEKNKNIEFRTDITIFEDDLFNYEVFDKNKNLNISYIDVGLYHYVQQMNSASNETYNLKKLSAFKAREYEIEILERNNINPNFLKVDYAAIFIRSNVLMKKYNLKKNELYNDILKKYKQYKKEITKKDLEKKLLYKYYVIKYFPFIYNIKIMISRERK